MTPQKCPQQIHNTQYIYVYKDGEWGAGPIVYTPPLADGDYTIVSVPRAATAGCNAYFGASTCATPGPGVIRA